MVLKVGRAFQPKSAEVKTERFAVQLSLSQPGTLVPSYYCLYSLFNKIRDKGKIVSAGY
jgi:hypothetical protein